MREHAKLARFLVSSFPAIQLWTMITKVTRKHPVSRKIYDKHIQLFRYLNDAWIFTHLLRPELDKKAEELRGSKSSVKKEYLVPKRNQEVVSRRRDRDIGDVFKAQCDRGIFETNIVAIVSRVEAFIQDCLRIAILDKPEKLVLIGDKNIPLNLFLELEDRDVLLEAVIESRCQELLFAKPKDYLEKFAKVLSIDIKSEIFESFIEMKASRDVIVHNRGAINKIYVEKAGRKGRGAAGEELVVDEPYFTDVIENAKLLSGAIQRETEKKYK